MSQSRLSIQAANTNTKRQWAEWKVAIILGLLLAAFIAAPEAKAWDPQSPIVGSIADDIIAIGDRQYGKTQFIVERQERYALKVRHQRTTLDGAEIFCTQHPLYVQMNYFGIRVNSYNESDVVTICNLAEETHQNQPSLQDVIRQGRAATLPQENSPADEDWLIGAQLKTERSYCIGNFESREFAALPDQGAWIAEGNVTEYQPQMFTGFDVMIDRESGTLFALSAPLDREAAREMGCALQPAMIVIKMSVSPFQSVADSSQGE